MSVFSPIPGLMDRVEQSAWFDRVLRLSPIVWPLYFLWLMRKYYAPVPDHWAWDTFSYLSAAKEGVPFARLGLGRVLFCSMGIAFEKISAWIGVDPLFGLFRFWVVSGIVLQTLALFVASAVLARRIGWAGAHIALALMVLHADSARYFLRVFPETWVTSFLLLAISALTWDRLQWPARLAVGAILGLLALLMKEVALFYFPALMVLAWLQIPQRVSLKGIGWAIGWGAATGGLAAWAHYRLWPWAIPGLREAQTYWTREHFHQPGVGLGFVAHNAVMMVRSFDRYWIWSALAGAGTIRLLILAYRAANRSFPAGLLSFGLCLTIIPAIALTITSQARDLTARYVGMILPGLCLLASGLLIPPFPVWPHRRWVGGATLALLLVFLVKTCYRGALYTPQQEALKCQALYAQLIDMRETDLAIVGGSDCMPAAYIQSFTHGGNANRRWMILWPTWGQTSGYFPTREWIEEHIQAGRTIAVSPTAAERTDLSLEEYLRRLEPLTFDPHPTGWWVSRPVESAVSL